MTYPGGDERWIVLDDRYEARPLGGPLRVWPPDDLRWHERLRLWLVVRAYELARRLLR